LTCRPFFDSVKINLPNAQKPLEITAKGASKNPYVKSLRVNGETVERAIITHEQIAQGGTVEFEMSPHPEAWASSTLVSPCHPFEKRGYVLLHYDRTDDVFALIKIRQVDPEIMQDPLIHYEL
jgi:hypothetical protein